MLLQPSESVYHSWQTWHIQPFLSNLRLIDVIAVWSITCHMHIMHCSPTSTVTMLDFQVLQSKWKSPADIRLVAPSFSMSSLQELYGICSSGSGTSRHQVRKSESMLRSLWSTRYNQYCYRILLPCLGRLYTWIALELLPFHLFVPVHMNSQLDICCWHTENLSCNKQNKRGGRVKLQSILMPVMEFDHPEKGDALYCMLTAFLYILQLAEGTTADYTSAKFECFLLCAASIQPKKLLHFYSVFCSVSS